MSLFGYSEKAHFKSKTLLIKYQILSELNFGKRQQQQQQPLVADIIIAGNLWKELNICFTYLFQI